MSLSHILKWAVIVLYAIQIIGAIMLIGSSRKVYTKEDALVQVLLTGTLAIVVYLFWN